MNLRPLGSGSLVMPHDRRLPIWIGLQILFSWGPGIDNARAGQTVQGVPNGPRAQEEMHVLGWKANPNSFVGWRERPLNSADCKRFPTCNESQKLTCQRFTPSVSPGSYSPLSRQGLIDQAKPRLKMRLGCHGEDAECGGWVSGVPVCIHITRS